jgi:hypothetical protein
MKKYAAGFLLVVLIGFPGFPLFAENDTVHFVIAPPPVGYPEIKKGEKIYQAGTDALFFTTDLNSEKLIVLGATAFGNYQESFTDWFTASLNFGGSFMAGSKYSMMILSLPLHMNGILELLDTEGFDLYLFGGGGGDLSVSMMIMDIPKFIGATPVYYDTTFTTTMVNGMVNCGAQAHITAGNLVFSPFGSWTYSGGTYTTTRKDATYEEFEPVSGSIENYSSTVFGFDVLYKPKDISLSSQLRFTDNYTMLSVAVKWLVDGFLPKPKGKIQE